MTATLPAPTIDSVLKRTDAQWARRSGDDPAPPEYLTALATALRPLLEQNGGPGADAEELARLQSESDARGRIIAQRDKTIEGLTEKLAKARQAGTAGVEREQARSRELAAELDEVRAELDTARGQLRDSVSVADVERLTAEIESLKEQLTAVGEQLAAANRDLALANRTLDEIADEEASRPAAAPHQHRYPLDLATGHHEDCECGQPWIRNLVEDETDDGAPDVEPWDALLGRIRAEAAEAGWTA